MASTRKSSASSGGGGGRLARHQKFQVERVHRTQLVGAEYNPRTITKQAQKKLKDNLNRVGLLEPLVWNKRTGRLVSGHQRLAMMDALEGTDDYTMDVSVVDLDEKTEREQNIFFNNPSVQGTYDPSMLEDLIGEGKLELANTGFELADLEATIGTIDRIGGNLLGVERTPEADMVIDTLSEITASRSSPPKGERGEKKAPPPAGDDLMDGEELADNAPEDRRQPSEPYTGNGNDDEPDDPKAKEIAAIKQAKKDQKAADLDRYDTEIFITLVFKTRAERDAFVTHIGSKPTERYHDGALAMQAAGMKVER